MAIFDRSAGADVRLNRHAPRWRGGPREKPAPGRGSRPLRPRKGSGPPRGNRCTRTRENSATHSSRKWWSKTKSFIPQRTSIGTELSKWSRLLHPRDELVGAVAGMQRDVLNKAEDGDAMAPGIVGSDVGPLQLAESSPAVCSRSPQSPGRRRSVLGPETPRGVESRQIARALGMRLAGGLVKRRRIAHDQPRDPLGVPRA